MRLALIESYRDAQLYLEQFSKQGKPITDLSRFMRLMAALGDPHRGLKAIHITGTNGKGSVTEYCASALTACGFKTGRFTSPYIINMRERITIDGVYISEEDYARLMNEVAQAVEREGVRDHSQFELQTAVCFLYFKEQQVDMCCIEVGIGGTLDCTNVLEAPAVSVITSVGLDHTAILGDTVEQIAQSKAGIIKGGSAVAASMIPQEAMNVIRSRCGQTGAVLHIPDRERLIVHECGTGGSRFSYDGEEYTIRMCGEHQIENCITAITALKCLDLSWEKVREGLSNAVLPARLEWLCEDVLLDGGHNPQSRVVLEKFLKQDKRPKTALIGMVATKDHESALRILLPCFEKAVFVQDFTDNTVPAEKMAAVAAEIGIEAHIAHGDPSEYIAYARSISPEGGLLFIGGSLYFASQQRQLFLE